MVVDIPRNQYGNMPILIASVGCYMLLLIFAGSQKLDVYFETKSARLAK